MSLDHDHDLPVFPTSPYHLHLYLRHLMADAQTASPIESAVQSIAWIHHLAGESSPSEHTLVKDVLTDAQRLWPAILPRRSLLLSIGTISSFKSPLCGLLYMIFALL